MLPVGFRVLLPEIVGSIRRSRVPDRMLVRALAGTAR